MVEAAANTALPSLQTAPPAALGLDPTRWDTAQELLRGWCQNGAISSAALLVGRGNLTTGTLVFGRQRLDDPAPVASDAIFLIASITKPLVAMAALLLVERGLIALGDRVTDYVPEFGREGKYGVTLRHLLTHTSGLPDMLPENRQLRVDHAPLTGFVEGACRVNLDFPPGRGVQYQSMGFAMLGEIIARVTGRPCARFLQDEFFDPLGMFDTALGAPDAWFEGSPPKIDRVPEIRIPDSPDGPVTNWNWNSRYWRALGAPWGGLLTTPADLARYARMMLQGGKWGDRQILGTATVAAATRNQLKEMRDVPEADRRSRPWGFGWRLNWPAHTANFGDLLGPGTYGHWGATGTLMWIDPERDAYCILFTTQPQEPLGTYLARVSNAVAAALI